MQPPVNHELDALWPRVGAEIERARRREALGLHVRRAAGPVSAAVLLAVAAGGAWHARRHGAWRSGPWDLPGVAPLRDASARYPLVNGDRVFAVRGQGGERRVMCADKQSGAVVWESSVRFSECRLACGDGRLYLLHRVAGSGWQGLALDVAVGRELWRRSLDEGAGGSPSHLTALEGGVTWCQGNRLVACAGVDGSTAWTREVAADDTFSALRVLDGAVFAVSRRAVHAYRAAGGEVLWSHPIAKRQSWERGADLIEIGGGRVYLARRTPRGKGRLVCLHADTGEPLWSAESELPLRLQAAAGRVFVRSAALVAFDSRTGTPAWHAPLKGCGPVSIAGDRVYVVDAADRRELVALDARSGRTAWRHSAPGSCNGIVVDGDTGYISGNDGILRALALK